MPGAQRGEVVAREVGMVQLGDEHGRHAVERGGALGLRRLQHGRRIEAVAGIDHGGAVGHAAQVAHHHAEAVVERHRDQQPVPVGEAQQLGGEVAVVEDVVVAERGALGIAGGPAGELDVDRIVELLLPLPPRQLVGADPLGHGQQLSPAEHSRRGAPRRAAPRRAGSETSAEASAPGRLAGQLRRQLVDHPRVVRGLEPRRGHQPRAAGLLERVLHLVEPVARVDVDEDRAQLGRGELGDRPLRAVRRPDPDALALLDAERDQRAGAAVDLGLELAVGVAQVLVTGDERLVVGVLGDGAVEQIADGEAEQRHVARAARVAPGVRGHVRSPRDHRRSRPPGCPHTATRIAQRQPGRYHDAGRETPMRLPARLGPKPRILFVGINPSLTSARVGHHFASPGNPFYRLLHAAGFVPTPMTFVDDVRLPDFGLGLTNIAERATREASELTRGRLRARAKAAGAADRRGAAGGGGVRGRHRVSTVLRTVGQLWSRRQARAHRRRGGLRGAESERPERGLSRLPGQAHVVPPPRAVGGDPRATARPRRSSASRDRGRRAIAAMTPRPAPTPTATAA